MDKIKSLLRDERIKTVEEKLIRYSISKELMGNLSTLERELDSIGTEHTNFIDKYTDWYFMPKPFEESGQFYEALGVRNFKKLCAETCRKLVRKTFGSDKIPCPNNYLLWNSSQDGLRKFDYATRINESVHLVAATQFVGSTIGYLSDGKWGMASLATGLNIVLGIYPILTQRYNRARLHHTIERMKQRDTPRYKYNY